MRASIGFAVVVASLLGCKADEDLAKVAQQAVAPFRERLLEEEAAIETARKTAAAWTAAVPPLHLGDRGVPQFSMATAVLVHAASSDGVAANGLSAEVEYALHPPRDFSPWHGSTADEVRTRVARQCDWDLTHRYAVVVRVLGEQQARITGYRTFEGGHIFADALVFDLADNTMMGGYPVVGMNRDTVTLHGVAAESDAIAESDLRSQAAEDLDSEATLRLDREVQAALAREQAAKK